MSADGTFATRSSDALDDAANLILQNGLNQDGRWRRTLPNGRTCRCVLGSLSHVLGKDDGYLAQAGFYNPNVLADQIRRALTDQLGDYGSVFALAHWSDNATEDEVVVALRAAADAERKAGR